MGTVTTGSHIPSHDNPAGTTLNKNQLSFKRSETSSIMRISPNRIHNSNLQTNNFNHQVSYLIFPCTIQYLNKIIAAPDAQMKAVCFWSIQNLNAIKTTARANVFGSGREE